MSELTLEQVRELRAGITPGEWTSMRRGNGRFVFSHLPQGDCTICETRVFGDAQAIAALPDALASLEAALERIRELEAELASWRRGAVEEAGENPGPRLRTAADAHNYFDDLGREMVETEARTRESIRRNLGTHKRLRELGG